MIVDELEKLIESGTFKKLVNAGIVSVKVKMQYDIYKRYCEISKVKTANVREIVWDVSDEFKVSESTVFLALKIMRK